MDIWFKVLEIHRSKCVRTLLLLFISRALAERSRRGPRRPLRAQPPGGDEADRRVRAEFLLPAAAADQTADCDETETEVRDAVSPSWHVFPFTVLAPDPLVCVQCSNKDEELLRTYKSVYSKLLRAEKNAPLLRRLELHIELLRQLTPHTGSDDTQP